MRLFTSHLAQSPPHKAKLPGFLPKTFPKGAGAHTSQNEKGCGQATWRQFACRRPSRCASAPEKRLAPLPSRRATSCSRELRIRAPTFFWTPILVGEPSPRKETHPIFWTSTLAGEPSQPKKKQSKLAPSWGTQKSV